MSSIHANKNLYVVARQSKKGILQEEDKHSINSTVLAHIGAEVQKNLIIKEKQAPNQVKEEYELDINDF